MTSILQGEASQDTVGLRLLYDRLTACKNELTDVNKEKELLTSIGDLETELMTTMGHEDDAITTLSTFAKRIDILQWPNISNIPARFAPSNATTLDHTALSSGQEIPRLDIAPFRGEGSKWVESLRTVSEFHPQ